MQRDTGREEEHGPQGTWGLGPFLPLKWPPALFEPQFLHLSHGLNSGFYIRSGLLSSRTISILAQIVNSLLEGVAGLAWALQHI